MKRYPANLPRIAQSSRTFSILYGMEISSVPKLARLARSVVGLANIIQKLEVKKVDLVVLDQGIDTTSIFGRLQCNILAAIGEFEREIIRERSYGGRLRALARGVKLWPGRS